MSLLGFLPSLIGGAAKLLGGAKRAGRAIRGAIGYKGPPPFTPTAGGGFRALPSIARFGPAGGGIVARAGGAVMGGVRALPGLGRVAVAGAGRVVARYPRSAAALAQLGLFAAGGWIYNAATGEPVGPASRGKRINPMNVKAMRRAIRRVKGGRKICAEIERMLPKRKASQSWSRPQRYARGGKECH